MDDRLRAARLLRRWLPLLLPILFACRPSPAVMAPTLGAHAPCCEREAIHDLFAAPYRGGAR